MPQPIDPKQALFAQLAVVARALGHGSRLELLDYLAQGERSVEDLAQVAGLSIANTSKHLQQLKAAGLVQARRDGKHIRYTLGEERVLDVMGILRGIAASHLDAVEDLVGTYLRGRDALEPVPAQDLLDRVRSGLVTVLDVRPPEERPGPCGRGPECPPGALAGAAPGPASGSRGGGLLPGSLVRAVLRGGGQAASGGLHRAPLGGRVAGVAPRRAASSERL